ncbi:hypothetical protein lerEdw1_000133 [Lerista edwardsae]|nr:hypothetical protein lerEdw1_000133 [Lerista edwardsae]
MQKYGPKPSSLCPIGHMLAEQDTQVMTPAHPSTSRAHTLPFRKHPGLLHLESCGDVSTFTTAENRLLERRTQRTEQERPHSLIGVVRETVL